MKNILIAPKRKKKIIVNDNAAFQIQLNKILKEEKNKNEFSEKGNELWNMHFQL